MKISKKLKKTDALVCFKSVIRPKTTIISDMWPTYTSVVNLGQNYVHLTLNHTQNFVNPVNRGHIHTLIPYTTYREPVELGKAPQSTAVWNESPHVGFVHVRVYVAVSTSK